MTQITTKELDARLAAGEGLVLLDVREEHEREAFNIGGLHIPMVEIASRVNEIPRDATVVVYCAKGIRSVICIQRLEGYGFTNLINLAGGVAALTKKPL